MKKLLAVLGIAAATIAGASAQLVVYDGFDYTASQNLTVQTTWSSLNTGVPPVVQAGNLSVSGLASPTGNRVSWDTGNIQEALKAVTSQSSGTVYYSFAFQLTALPTTATYSFALGTGNTNYAAPVWLQASGSNFNIGLSNRSNSTPNYAIGTYSLSTTYFLVGSYTFNSGTGDDASSLWIDPISSSFGADTAPTPSLTATGGTDMTAISQFLIRGAAGSPSGIMDELRIGTTWASVTPVPEPSTWALAGLGAGLVLWRLRRKRTA